MSIKMWLPKFLISGWIFFSYLLKGILLFFLSAFLLALTDAYFGLRMHFSFPFAFIPIVVFFFWIAIGLPKALFRKKTLALLESWYKKYPAWLTKSPSIIFDLIEGKIHPPQSLTKLQIQNLIQLDLPKLVLLPKKIWLKEILGKIFFLSCIFLSLSLWFLSYGKISPFRIFQKLTWLSFEEFTIIPEPGNYLMGRPLEISLKYLSPEYDFLYFENSKTRNIISQDKTIYWETFTEPLTLHLVVKRGIEKIYSRPFTYNPILPGHFKSIVFQVIPPTSLAHAIRPFYSQEHLLSVHYGSLVNVFIYHTGDSEIYWKNNRLVSQNQMAKVSFLFSTQSEKEVFFILKDKNSGVSFQSPKYYLQEAQDQAPKAQILVNKNKFFFPEKGTLRLAYQAFDDFGFRALYFILKTEIGELKKIHLPIVSKKVGDGYLVEGNANINLKQIPGNLVQIALVARDNSMIVSSLGKEKGELGQIGMSDFLEIYFAKNSEEKQSSELALQKEMESNLTLLYEEFQNLEQDFQKLFQRLAQKETGDKIEAELNQWIKKRQQLQEKIQQYAQTLTQSRSTSVEESERKKFLLKELNFILEEKIREKERELKKLLENFPQDFEISEEIREKLSRQEYLKSLENAIEHLKQMQFLRTLKELEKKLAKEILETENLINEAYQAKEQVKEKSKAQIERLENLTLTKEETLSELSQTMFRKIQETQESVEKAQKIKDTIEALSKRRQTLNTWRDELRKLKQKSGLFKYEEAVKKLQEVAFGINRIAEVWSQQTQGKNPNISEKNVEKLRIIAQELFSSYSWESQKLEKGDLFLGSLVGLFKQGEALFRELSREVSLDFVYSYYDKSRLLRYKLNQISKELLRQMSFMKMSAMGIAQELEQEELSEISESQQGLGEALRQMGDGQKSKEALTESEKAYLEDLASRQNFLSQKLRQLAQSGYSQQKNFQELAEISQEMEKHARDFQNLNTREEIRELLKKQEQIEEKFLRLQKGRRQKPEWDTEREAVQAREYYLPPSEPVLLEKLPEKKLIHFPIPEGERGKFYLKFRQNLEKLP